MLYTVRTFPDGHFLSSAGKNPRPFIMACRSKENAERIRNAYIELSNLEIQRVKKNVIVQGITKDALVSMFTNSCIEIAIIDADISIKMYPSVEQYKKMLTRVIHL